MIESSDTAPLDVELAAKRLLDTIDAACQSAEGFPERLGAALKATMGLFAGEPDLIDVLTAREVSEIVRTLQRRVCSSCAARLRSAAESTGNRTGDLFVEDFLVTAVRFEVSLALHEDETDLLPERASDLRDFILVYYPGALTT